MSLDKNLKKLRKQYKLSQEELAKELKISRQAISRWEVYSGSVVKTKI